MNQFWIGVPKITDEVVVLSGLKKKAFASKLTEICPNTIFILDLQYILCLAINLGSEFPKLRSGSVALFGFNN